jgi:replicative DNA helicase
MPGLEWAERALAIFADVAPEVVEEWAKDGTLGRQAAEFLECMQHALVVDEFVQLSELGQVFRRTRTKLKVPLRLVLLDYIGLLGVQGRDAYDRASALDKGLKQVAKAENVAVVVAMQVNRGGGDGSEPVTIAMLRDSGVLEESLDFLLGAWRPWEGFQSESGRGTESSRRDARGDPQEPEGLGRPRRRSPLPA